MEFRLKYKFRAADRFAVKNSGVLLRTKSTTTNRLAEKNHSPLEKASLRS